MSDLEERHVENKLEGKRTVWKTVGNFLSSCRCLEGTPKNHRAEQLLQTMVWVETKCFTVDTLPDTLEEHLSNGHPHR